MLLPRNAKAPGVASLLLFIILLALPSASVGQELVGAATAHVPVGPAGTPPVERNALQQGEGAPPVEVLPLNDGLRFGDVVRGYQKTVQRVQPEAGKVLVRVERPNGGPRQRGTLLIFITFPRDLTMIGSPGETVAFEGAVHASQNKDDAQGAESAGGFGRYAYFSYNVRTRQEAGSQFGKVYIYLHGEVDIGMQKPAGEYNNFIEVQAYYSS